MDMDFYLLVLLLIIKIRKNKHRRIRRWGVRPINQSRDKMGFFKVIFLKMKKDDREQFFKYTRMSANTFDFLLSLVKIQLKRRSRKAISPEMKLAVTLIYLSQGDSVQSVAWCYHLGKTTVRQIVLETCVAIYEKLKGAFLSPPSTEEWTKISNGFDTKWNFPNCVGAIDGKHIAIRLPPNTGSQYYNYKKFFSIVLLAVCDANYNFVMVDVGFSGSESDGGIFKRSQFGKAIMSNKLNLPSKRTLLNTAVKYPHYFVGDAAFPLMENLMRPFPGNFLSDDKLIFNYRLSRARRTIENAFGILVARWRVLLTTLHLRPENATRIVLATACLHNFIKTHETNQPLVQYCPVGYGDVTLANGEVLEGHWRDEINQPLASVRRLGHNRSANVAYKLRDDLKEYFNGVGAVPWQTDILIT